jgi:peroxiredoxin Q/BCP
MEWRNMAEGPKAGELAPDFEAQDQNGRKVALASFRGRPVVLYFYPKDNTPGCTAEACSFRDSMSILRDRGIVVLGVSVDSEESHARFADKYKLNFTLISDRRKIIVRAYGVESSFGIAKRVTFIIGPNGMIKHVFPRVSAKTHGEDVLKKLKELGLA